LRKERESGVFGLFKERRRWEKREGDVAGGG